MNKRTLFNYEPKKSTHRSTFKCAFDSNLIVTKPTRPRQFVHSCCDEVLFYYQKKQMKNKDFFIVFNE